MFVRRAIPVIVLASLCFTGRANAAAPLNIPEHHTRVATFSIPLTPNPGTRVRDVELYVSTDGGRTWTYAWQGAPSTRREDNRFRYTAPSDGTYWFGVRSI